MTEVKKLPQRKEVPVELTWDLELIFANSGEFDTAVTELEQQVTTFLTYQGQVGQSAQTLLTALEAWLDLDRALEKIYVYASMKNDQDTKNAEYQALFTRVQKLVAEVSAKIAWFEPELLALSEETVATYLQVEPKLQQYQHLLEVLLAKKPHILSDKEEALLAGASDILGAPENIFGVLNNADFKFAQVSDEAGNKVQLSQGLYGKLLESVNREVRKEAFEKLYLVYHQFRHTLATTLATHVRMHNFEAKLRGYNSAQERALASNSIPVKVYTTLLEQVEQHLPLLHRYVELRKKVLGLTELHMYDLYTPLTGKANLAYTYEEAKQESLKALAVLGDDYLGHVKEAYASRWIDVVENEGKRSGAYSSGVYDTAPYILLNWQDNLDNLFTLVHEMGHSMHTYLTTHNQPYQYGDYPIFLAEIASTTNENLLTQYLLETQKDPQVQAYVLNHYLDGFKGTVFRQAQFAQFELWLHEQEASGQALTAEKLADYYGKLNQHYYGSAVVNDQQIAYEWARIPHFYYNFYVYQYATGFAAATTLSQNILSKDPAKLTAYLDYLKAGSSNYPLEVMKQAGINMEESAYLQESFKVFEKRLNQLEGLLLK
ncbi:oligoendopeptidase F [Ligilactobacillus agilis]|uniref:oligoendopeptidase F n=1 Tax=Ligilactobacillus agilis TaxID=1601 RepID=UPI001958A52A|nr:oligoendopeptidase F [Ligilactobacillus agilis]MBM6772599.1 oligoendopeptidase F [Ligilactobacillus agilis]